MPKYGITSRVENETDLVLEKIFVATQEQLFEVFTKTEYLKNFWGPRNWELIHSSIDFKPEGEWFYGMKNVDENQESYGMESWGKTIYKKIEAPDRMVYVDYFADKSGEINRELPVAQTEMIFKELDENRSILSSRTTYQTKEELQDLIDAGMLQGMAEMWDRLSDYLEEKFQ